jgi:hypothetical protein
VNLSLMSDRRMSSAQPSPLVSTWWLQRWRRLISEPVGRAPLAGKPNALETSRQHKGPEGWGRNPGL